MRLVLLLAAALALAPAAAQATLVFNRDAADATPAVWVAADDGHGAHRLASNAADAHVSPDGRSVAYRSLRRSSLVLVPSTGGRMRVLLAHQRDADVFAWSPDSRTIAAVSGREVGTKRLVLIDVDSGAARTVARGQFYGVSFSPTGGAIVYSRASTDDHYPPRASLWLAPVDGGRSLRITHGHSDLQPLWGHDLIVFARERRAPSKYDAEKQDLYVLAPTDTAPRRLTFQRPAMLMFGLSPVAWSPDGVHLVANFVGQDTGFVQTVDPSVGQVRTPVKPAADVLATAISRDGTTILGTRGGPEMSGNHSAVVSLPYDGGAPTVLAAHAYSPDWSR